VATIEVHILHALSTGCGQNGVYCFSDTDTSYW